MPWIRKKSQPWAVKYFSDKALVDVERRGDILEHVDVEKKAPEELTYNVTDSEEPQPVFGKSDTRRSRKKKASETLKDFNHSTEEVESSVEDVESPRADDDNAE